MRDSALRRGGRSSRLGSPRRPLAITERGRGWVAGPYLEGLNGPRGGQGDDAPGGEGLPDVPGDELDIDALCEV